MPVEVLDRLDYADDWAARDFGDIRDFNGADITGATDSSAAFKTAGLSGAVIDVPPGNWRIDDQVIVDNGTAWRFAPAILPNYRWHANSSQAIWDRTNCGCRLFKDNSSANLPFFRVRSGWVDMLGFPLLDVGLRDSFTAEGVLYALGEGNDALSATTAFHYPRVWGGLLQLQMLGNYDTIINEGEGARAVRVDWGDAPVDPNLDNAYTTKLKWDIRAQLVHTLAQIETKEAPSQWSNSGFMNLESHGAKRSLYNDGTNDIRITGYHQADNNLHINERHLPVLYFGPNSRENAYDFEFHDLNDSPSGGARPGNYRNSVAVEDHGWKTLELLQGTARKLAPIGTIVRNQRTAYDTTSLGGIVNTFEHNVLANFSLRAAHEGGTFSHGFFAGEETISTTAVSDCVFANQVDDTVDITSVLGLPTWVVGARFTLSDHSVADNNGEYRVLSTVANGYNCEKIAGAGYVYDPIDAAAEAVTITTGIGAICQDSVSAAITASTDLTIPAGSNLDYLAHTYAEDWVVFTPNAQAVTDQDYLEYHGSGVSFAPRKVIASISYNGRFEAIQFIGLNSGVVLINEIFVQANVTGSTASRPEVIEFDLSTVVSVNIDEFIFRIFGPDTADKQISINDFAAIEVTPREDGHYLSPKGGQVIYNSNTLSGGDWDAAHVIIGNIHIFTNASNEVRASIGAPTSSSDGALIGTAT